MPERPGRTSASASMDATRATGRARAVAALLSWRDPTVAINLYVAVGRERERHPAGARSYLFARTTGSTVGFASMIIGSSSGIAGPVLLRWGAGREGRWVTPARSALPCLDLILDLQDALSCRERVGCLKKREHRKASGSRYFCVEHVLT